MMRSSRDWHDLAALNPYWAVLTRPEYRENAFDLDDFLASGERDVAAALAGAEELGLPRRRAVAVDFGCGLGRLTGPLGHRFERVYGVDFSPALLEQARALNRDSHNCEFELIAGDGLPTFSSASVDLVCSLLVLQHQTGPEAIRRQLREFVRVLKPDGLAVFQLPTHIPLRHRIQPRRRLYGALRLLGAPARLLYSRLRLDPLRMTHLSSDDVEATVVAAGGRVLKVVDDGLAAAFPSATYYVVGPCG